VLLSITRWSRPVSRHRSSHECTDILGVIEKKEKTRKYVSVEFEPNELG
jgi:hypothetical protein